MPNWPVAGSVTSAEFTMRALRFSGLSEMRNAPPGSRTTPGISGSASATVAGRLGISLASWPDTDVDGEEPCSTALPSPFTSTWVRSRAGTSVISSDGERPGERSRSRSIAAKPFWAIERWHLAGVSPANMARPVASVSMSSTGASPHFNSTRTAGTASLLWSITETSILRSACGVAADAPASDQNATARQNTHWDLTRRNPLYRYSYYR